MPGTGSTGSAAHRHCLHAHRVPQIKFRPYCNSAMPAAAKSCTLHSSSAMPMRPKSSCRATALRRTLVGGGLVGGGRSRPALGTRCVRAVMWLALFASKVSHQQKFMALRRLWFDRQGSQPKVTERLALASSSRGRLWFPSRRHLSPALLSPPPPEKGPGLARPACR
jgi:hypothetical protein